MKENIFKNIVLTILDTSPLATLVLENEQIEISNHAVERTFGWKPKEMIGQSTRLLYPTEDVYNKVSKEVYLPLKKESKVIKSAYPCQHKDGSIILCRISASRTTSKPINKKVVVTYENITELKKMESKLSESEMLYRTLAEGAFAGVYVVQNGKFKYMNHYAASNLGYLPNALIGRRAYSVVHVDDRNDVRKYAREMLEGTRTAPYRYRALNKNREIRWIMETVTGIVYEGKPAILGNNMDITDYMKQQQKLEESNDLKTSILDAAPHAIMYLENRKIMLVSNAVESVLGWKPEELIGKKTRMLFHSEKDFQEMGRMAYGTLEKSRIFDSPGYRYKHRDGREIICHIKAARVGGALNEGRLITTFEDITEQIKTMQELKLKTQNLEETNMALNVILKKREADKSTMEKSVVSNINTLILPCIEQIKKYHIKKEVLKYVLQIESYLTDLISPFLFKLSQKYPSLTPKEIVVANFLKEGKSNKEIAELLNITAKGVGFHRDKIRLKLGIKYTNTNVRSQLLKFESD